MDRHLPSLDPQTHNFLEVEDLKRLLLGFYPGVVFGLDLEGRIRWLNPAALERLGYDQGALVGRELVGSLVTEEDLESHAAALGDEWGESIAADIGVLSARLRRGQFGTQDWSLRHEDGSPQPTRLSIGALRDQHGVATGLIAVEAIGDAGGDELLRLTHHDTLTGLPNRAMLSDRAEMALQRATRQKSVVAFMMVEFAGFEALCKEHGRSVGDDVLRATASRLHFELRKTDTAVRFDNGQFAVMLVDLHNADEAKTVADKIGRALSAKVNVGVAIIPLTARIGVAWFPDHGNQLLPLLEAAEAAANSLPTGESGVACAAFPASR